MQFMSIVSCYIVEVGFEPVRFHMAVQPLNHYTILPFTKDRCSMLVKNKIKALCHQLDLNFTRFPGGCDLG